MTNNEKPKNIDEYIMNFPDDIQLILKQIRATIRKSAPEAVEAISYQMPAFKQNGNLVYFAAYKNHIGFYPTSSGIANFKDVLSNYEMSKGTVRFPLDKPIPLELISKIVEFRVMEHKAKLNKRKK